MFSKAAVNVGGRKNNVHIERHSSEYVEDKDGPAARIPRGYGAVFGGDTHPETVNSLYSSCYYRRQERR